MGLAIAGMHYTAIAAVNQLNTKVVNAVTHNIDNRMAVTIGIATLILLALAVVAAVVAQRLTVENARIEALRQSTNRFRCLEQN